MTNKREFISKAYISLSVSAFCSLSIFLFTPIHIYFANINAGGLFCFNISSQEILNHCFLISSVMLLLLLAILLCLPVKFFKKAVVFIFTFTFAYWFFNNILVWDYGLFDGRTIDWEKFNYRGFVDLSIYVLFLFLLTKKAPFIYKYSRNTSLILLSIQLISLLTLNCKYEFEETMFSRDFLKDQCRYQINALNKFNFSNKKNVIIVVLDSFQTDLFSEIVNNQKTIRKFFDGFSYFPNAVGGYSSTSFTTPLILTGKYFDNSESVETYLKQSYLSDYSIPKQLKLNGFSTDIYPKGHFLIDPSIASNYKTALKQKFICQKKLFDYFVMHDLGQLYDIALFRICPHFFRKYIYNNNKLFLTALNYNYNIYLSEKNDTSRKKSIFYKKTSLDSNVIFIKEFRKKISVHNDNPTFKYYHLTGIHTPMILDENLRSLDKPLPISRNSFLRCAEALLKLMSVFIEDLKKQEVYDNSLIFIIGDHGTRHIPVNIQATGLKDTSVPGPIDSVIKFALPLILVKPFNSRGRLKTNKAPVTLADIRPTIFDELDIRNENRSMFKISINAPSKRRFFMIKKDRSGYKPELDEYKIEGFSWLKSSWKKIK